MQSLRIESQRIIQRLAGFAVTVSRNSRARKTGVGQLFNSGRTMGDAINNHALCVPTINIKGRQQQWAALAAGLRK